ncbi:MAG TPA: hypothetical protein VF812_06215 [Ktedonobacterales bacterium]
MTNSTSRYDADEAQKELMATLHASRELGPEMDDTLTDRFMERLGALRPAGSFDQARTRADLMSLLRSSRGSDPAGDDALVSSFLTNIRPPATVMPAYAPYAPNAGYAPNAPMPPMRYSPASRIIPMAVMIGIFLVSLALTHGHSFWFIWLLPLFLGWGRRGYYQRRLERDQRRYYRHNRIMRPDDPFNRTLPPSGPPEIL